MVKQKVRSTALWNVHLFYPCLNLNLDSGFRFLGLIVEII